ncbi:MAG: hypothetical protein SFW65_03325 [Alphaproteobacteria bacterium]|nr:hypothetical protein [Alphaproteobacteria bacterium]
MTNPVLGSNVLTDQSLHNKLYASTPRGVVTLSRELLADLKTRGLNYLHLASNSEGGQIFVVASKDKVLSNQLPEEDLIKQHQQGLVGLSQISSHGIRLGEGGPIISAHALVTGTRILPTGVVAQEGLDWQARLSVAPALRHAPN